MLFPELLGNVGQPSDPRPPFGPISQGLVFAFNGRQRFNLVNGTALSTGAGSPAYAASKRGVGLDGDGTYYANTTTRFNAGSGYTLFALVANQPSGSAGFVFGDDAASRKFQFWIASDKVTFTPFDSGGGFVQIQSSVVSAADLAGFAMLGRVDKNGNAEAWYNYERTTGSLGAAPAVPSDPRIFDRKDGGTSFRFLGQLICGFMWDRCLTISECQAMVADPFHPFRLPTERIYFNVVASTTTVTPGKGALALTAYAPSIVYGGTRSVTPGKGALSLTAYAPGITRTVTPGVGHLTLASYAPSLVYSGTTTVTPGKGALTLTSYAPSINQYSLPTGLYLMSLYTFTMFGAAKPVTPHDTNENRYRALQVVTAGNLVVTPLIGNAPASNITYTSVPAGTIIPFEVCKVLSTGTTASVVGLA